MSDRARFLELTESHKGEPYYWGGDDPILGHDCSGMVIDDLQAVGVLPPGDWTAHMLLERFKARRVTAPKPGDLLFWDWGQDGKIDHVEVCFRTNDQGVPICIGSSGGGSRHCVTSQEIKDAIDGKTSAADLMARLRLMAARDNALVKERPARPGWIAVDPFTGASR